MRCYSEEVRAKASIEPKWSLIFQDFESAIEHAVVRRHTTAAFGSSLQSGFNKVKRETEQRCEEAGDSRSRKGLVLE